jgi:hypothetical protein
MATPSVRVVDFDAFRAEQEKNPVFFKIGGEKYQLPDTLPASVAIGLIRWRADVGEDGEIPVEAIDTFGRAIFTEALWTTILDKHRLTVDEIPVLLQNVMEVYTGEAPKAESPTSPKKEPSSV